VVVECPVCRRRFSVSSPEAPMPKHGNDEYPEVECLGSGQPGEPIPQR
jgi:hypothetical protein